MSDSNLTTDAKSLFTDIKRAGELLDMVEDKMLEAQAGVVEEAQVFYAGTMLKGPYYAGEVAASVKSKTPKGKKGNRYVDIKFEGEIHGNRAAEVAYVNEYGKKSQEARPFIKTANQESAHKSIEAGMDVFDNWLRNNKL